MSKINSVDESLQGTRSKDRVLSLIAQEYPHDELLATAIASGALNEESERWRDHGQHYWPQPPAWGLDFLAEYKIADAKVAA